MRQYLFLAWVLLASAAAAADAPTIDFTSLVINPITEKPFTQPGSDCKPGQFAGKDCSEVEIMLGDAAVTALEALTDQDRGVDGKTKFDRDELARKIYKNNAAVLSVDEIKIIKDRIGLVWPPAMVGATWRMIDPSLKGSSK